MSFKLRWPNENSPRYKVGKKSSRPLKIPKCRSTGAPLKFMELYNGAKMKGKSSSSEVPLVSQLFEVDSRNIDDLLEAVNEPFEDDLTVTSHKDIEGSFEECESLEKISDKLIGLYSYSVTDTIIEQRGEACIPREIIDWTDVELQSFSHCLHVYFGTNASTKCFKMFRSILQASYAENTLLKPISVVNEVLVSRKTSLSSVFDRTRIMPGHTAIVKPNMPIEILMCFGFLKYYLLLLAPSMQPVAQHFAQLRWYLEFLGGKSVMIHSSTARFWMRLYLWQDAISSMMVFRKMSFLNDFKSLAFEEDTFTEMGDSSLYAVIGCPESLASILIDLAYMAGEYGVEAFSDQTEIPISVRNELSSMVLDLSLWKACPQHPQESQTDYETRLYLSESWKWGILFYIYSVFYREPSDSAKLNTLRQNIITPIKKYPPDMTKQLLWPFFTVVAEISPDDQQLQDYCLDILDMWFQATNGTGMFKAITDLLLEIWNLRKRSGGSIRWWDILKFKYFDGKEALYT